MLKPETAFARQMEVHDTTIGWRFINPKMEEAYGVDPLVHPHRSPCASGLRAASDRDAPTHLRSRAERRGARPARSRPARARRLHRAARSDRAAERGGRRAAGDRAGLALRGADRAQRHPRLQRPRPCGPDRRLLAAQERRPGAGRSRAGAAARHPAPVAARLRPRPEHLDARPAGARSRTARG